MKLASDNTTLAESESVPRTTELKLDGWISTVTGMGVRGKDKGASTEFVRRPHLAHETLDAIYRQDPLGARISDVIVADALREGFKIKFTGDGDVALSAEDTNDIISRMIKWKKAVKMKSHVVNHLRQSRVYGGSVLVMGLNDGQDPIDPLNEDAVKSFTFLKALDRFQVSPSGQLDTDPASCNFGFPGWYLLNSVFGAFDKIHSGDIARDVTLQAGKTSTSTKQSGTAGPDEERSEADPTLNNVIVHTSRVVRTDGVVLSDRSRLNNDGWGDSVFERAFEPLKNWNTAMNATGTLVHDMNSVTYGIKNLAEVLQANNGELLMKRFQAMELVRSVWNATFIDADGETLTRTATDFKGLPEVIDKFGVHLAAASSMPITLILGISPGGFGTGESEGDNWDDVVKAYQDDVVTPVVEQVLTQLFNTPEFKDVPGTWEIEWNPLKQMSDIQKADIMLKVAQADATNIASNVLAPHEVTLSRYGGESFSLETQLDEKMRNMMAPAEEGSEQEASEAEAAEQNAQVEAEAEAAPPEAEAPEEPEEAPEPEEGTDAPEGAAEPEDEPEEAEEVAPEAAAPVTPPAPPPTPVGAMPNMPEPAAVVEAGGATDPDDAKPTAAFAGGQVQAMTAVIGQVMTGDLPFESAVMVLTISFPLSEPEARAMLQPALDLQEVKMAEKAAVKAAMPPAMQAEMDKPGPGAMPGAAPTEGEETPPDANAPPAPAAPPPVVVVAPPPEEEE